MKRKDFIEKIHLGDSIYAHWDNYQIVLEDCNGYDNETINKISLQISVIDNLIYYRRKSIKMLKK